MFAPPRPSSLSWPDYLGVPAPGPRPPARPTWKTLEDLARAAGRLACLIPADAVAVAGVARSGLPAAAIVAMLRHLPLATISPAAGLAPCSQGWRLADTPWPDQGRVVVVDDTIASGNSLHKIARQIHTLRQTRPVTVAVVYASPEAASMVDIYAELLTTPHLLAWNLFNSCYTDRLALDFDGVICEEIPIQDCDDASGGTRYAAALEHVRPLYLPRRAAVPLVVSGRPEAYRHISQVWLSSHQVTARRLEMWPGTPQSRFRRGPEPVARFKAKHYRRSTARLFVESCPIQAAEIFRASDKAVLCPTTGQIWGVPDL